MELYFDRKDHSADCLAFHKRAKEYVREMAMSVDADGLKQMLNDCLDDCPANPRLSQGDTGGPK